MQYTINLPAGKEVRQVLQGKTFVLVETGAANMIDVDIEIQGMTAERFQGIKRGFKLQSPGAPFTSAVLMSAVDTTIEVVVSAANISVNYQDGSSVNATLVGVPQVRIAEQPIEVFQQRGTPAMPFYVSGVTYEDAPATAVTNTNPVTVTSTGAVIMDALATRKAARIANLGPDAVTIGGAGLTWAQRTIVLNAGDVWVEERAANVAWTAITDATKTASVAVQGVLA